MRRPGEPEPGDEPLVYAVLLRRGTLVSLVVLVLTFALYGGGLVPPLVPIDRLPAYWRLRAGEYLSAAHLPRGWGWVRYVAFGDILGYLGIVMLASLTVAAYLAILPLVARKKDTPYLLIVLAEIAVLLLAASGLLSVGR